MYDSRDSNYWSKWARPLPEISSEASNELDSLFSESEFRSIDQELWSVIPDTNAISALAWHGKQLINRLDEPWSLAVTVISLGEKQYGIRLSRYWPELESWLRRKFLPGVDILFPDLSTVEHYADIRKELREAGIPIPANDLWIAALGRQHDFPVLSLEIHVYSVRYLTRIAW